MKDKIPTQKGVYGLVIKVTQRQFLPIGKIGGFLFNPGFYAYIGSAQGGLRNRIKRHLNSQKKKHWHIDYLLTNNALVTDIVFSITSDRIECQVAHKLTERLSYIPGFGVSDCQCLSHLFFHHSRQRLIQELEQAFIPYHCSRISKED